MTPQINDARFSRSAPACLPALLLVLALGASALGGCNIVTPAAYIIHGPPQVDAEYTLADRPTVVFIDDRENLVNPVSFRRVIADKVSQDLMVKKLVTRTISPQDAMMLASRRDSASDVMPIDAIGRAVGAEQVIYVEMLGFADHMEGGVPRAVALCRVRVIDVEKRERLFPAPSEQSAEPGRVLQIITREFSPDLYRSRGTRQQIVQTLSEETGERIAKLFYRHEPRELGRSLNPR
jgi:hypothetical protein